jgi:hypothetical protein
MMAEDYVCKNEIGGAEAHRLIAETIYNILNILETNKEHPFRTLNKILHWFLYYCQ